MSDTKNIKLGTCLVLYGGVDLGYTQGGVEVTVSTDTHEVNVDQFGKSVVNEIIMGRNVSAKCPLAETTLENLVKIMPGASLIKNGETAATATMTVTTNPVANDTIAVNGVVFTFAVAAPGLKSNQIALGASAAATAANIAAALSAYEDPNVAEMTYSAAAAAVTLTSVRYGTPGNAYTIAAQTATANSITLSGATLSGGVDGTYYVSTPTGVGQSLLAIAQELILHPRELPATDHSQDFVIPLAATAGAIKYTYKLDTERLFDVTFKGYPNPVNDELFRVGQAA